MYQENQDGNNAQLPFEEVVQTAMMEATLNAAVLLKTLLEKKSVSSEEKNIADIALRLLEITSQAGSNPMVDVKNN
jgi:hypothetical protein